MSKISIRYQEQWPIQPNNPQFIQQNNHYYNQPPLAPAPSHPTYIQDAHSKPLYSHQPPIQQPQEQPYHDLEKTKVGMSAFGFVIAIALALLIGAVATGD